MGISSGLSFEFILLYTKLQETYTKEPVAQRQISYKSKYTVSIAPYGFTFAWLKALLSRFLPGSVTRWLGIWIPQDLLWALQFPLSFVWPDEQAFYTRKCIHEARNKLSYSSDTRKHPGPPFSYGILVIVAFSSTPDILERIPCLSAANNLYLQFFKRPQNSNSYLWVISI